jgi:hypothetical protein
LASTVASRGASTVGIQDAGAYYTGTNVETALAEVGVDITTLQGSTHNSGMKNGFRLGYSSTTAITISGGIWAHDGTTNQHVYTATQLTFTLGPAGSNSDSSNLGANEVHYIYIDNTAVVAAAARLLTATEFVNSTTAPAWSQAKVGWYNGNDRCIGAVLTDGSNHVLSFVSFSKQYYRYAAPVSEFTVAAAGVTYASLDCASSIPRFATLARFRILTGTSNATYYFDTSSTAQQPETHTFEGTITVDLPVSAAQALYWYCNSTADTTIHVCGYYTDGL